MSKARYFFLSMNVGNGLLAAGVAAGVIFSAVPFPNQAMISMPPAKEAASWSEDKVEQPQSSSHVDYAVISEQNLFHPERKIPPDKQQEKVMPRPELFLYGTLITDDMRIAFVEDRKAPYSTAGRGKRQMTLKKGMNLRGYVVSEIEPNRIVLVKDEDRLVVMLDDRQKRRTSEQAAPSPAAQRAIPGGTSHSQSASASAPLTGPASAQAVTSQAAGITVSGSQHLPPAAQAFPQTAPAFTQAEPSAPGPGVGSSGTWPPTRSSIEQTQQKIRDARQMRLNQMQTGQ